MGSPCEILCESDDDAEALQSAQLAADEAWRIEDKFSRYLPGNIVDRLNTANGEAVEVDSEMSDLLNFATTLNELSEGSFDITSGVLRQVWRFDGSDRLPSKQAVRDVLQHVGWSQVSWQDPTMQMPAGMEIDLGGVAKEYAVDRATGLLKDASSVQCLINFGGDLAATGAPRRRTAWLVGIEGPVPDAPDNLIELRAGALATSGDAMRFLLSNGVRYRHILDPRTGWPVSNAAQSITVAADTCTQAGILSTLAMLKGDGAEDFLTNQAEQFWIRR